MALLLSAITNLEKTFADRSDTLSHGVYWTNFE